MVTVTATKTKPPKPEIKYPWGPQLGVLRSPALFRLYQSGQGGGKTVLGCFETRQYAKQHSGSIVIATEPTYPMVRDILRVEFAKQFSDAGEWDRVTWRASEYKYLLANGAEIWLRQCDKTDALRGPSVAGVWMDEAAQSPHLAFQILVGRMRQQPFPHFFFCTGTPRGRNWLYWVFTEGDRPEGAPLYIGSTLEDANVATFFASALDNPYLDPVTKASLQAAYAPGTPLYRQEVLGETTVFEGIVYTQFQYEHHVRELPQSQQFVRVVLAQDWGWTNPGALLALGYTATGTIWVLAEVCETERKVGWWAEQARALAEKHDADTVFCDPSEPANIAEMNTCHRGRWLAVGAENAVIPGITAVGAALAEDRLFVTPSCVKLIGELQSYAWKTRREGGDQKIRHDEPEKVNDHCVDALRYGMLGLLIRPAVTRTIQIAEPVTI